MQSCDDRENAFCPVLRSVPATGTEGAIASAQREGARWRAGRFSMLGMIFHRFAERSSLSALIGSSPARSSPRVLAPRVARYPPAPGSPRTCSCTMEIPGQTLMDFVVDVAPDELGNCTRKTFWSTQKRPGRKSSE